MDKIDYLHPTAIAQIKAVLNGEPVPDNTDNRDGHIHDVRYLTPYAVEQIIEAGGSGASSADKVSYDNTTSGLTATDVQGAIDEVLDQVDDLSAAKVSYDNATSGLTATTVQSAIDEVGANLGEYGSKVDSLMDRADLVSVQAENVGYGTSNVANKLNALDNQINGNHISQATQIYLGSYDSSGRYTYNANIGYFFVDIKAFRGQSITCNSSLVTQYAFFKNFTPGQNATLAEGTSRVTGKPVSVTIPQDADVLYVYIYNNITSPIPLVSVTGEVNGIVGDLRLLAESKMYAEKTTTALYVYRKLNNGKYVGFPLLFKQASFVSGQYPSYYDNWGIKKVGIYEMTENGMQLFSEIFQGGESELAINATSGISAENVYVGGSLHGFENITTDANGRNIAFIVDNQKVGETDVFTLRSVSRVEVIQKTQLCQAYTNSNPFADAFKIWTWDNDGFKIKTSVKITRSVSIGQAQLGMFCVNRRWNGDTSQPYLTNRAIKNNLPFEVFNIEDGWSISQLMYADYDCTKITEYGDMGLGFSMEIKDANTRANGGMFVHNNGTGKYNKIYYANCNSFNPNVGDELIATQVWSIEG